MGGKFKYKPVWLSFKGKRTYSELVRADLADVTVESLVPDGHGDRTGEERGARGPRCARRMDDTGRVRREVYVDPGVHILGSSSRTWSSIP